MKTIDVAGRVYTRGDPVRHLTRQITQGSCGQAQLRAGGGQVRAGCDGTEQPARAMDGRAGGVLCRRVTVVRSASGLLLLWWWWLCEEVRVQLPFCWCGVVFPRVWLVWLSGLHNNKANNTRPHNRQSIAPAPGRPTTPPDTSPCLLSLNRQSIWSLDTISD
jgi:hypothetical protein